MGRIIYNKLVRDRIPEYVRSKGVKVSSRVLPETERLAALKGKILEEATELKDAKPEKIAEEIADVLEIIEAISKQAKISWNDVLKIQEEKRQERGGFSEGIFLEYTED